MNIYQNCLNISYVVIPQHCLTDIGYQENHKSHRQQMQRGRQLNVRKTKIPSDKRHFMIDGRMYFMAACHNI